ncbi:hypothetical protein D9Q98_005436 [Chlorella vulgaris]|uniref:Methionine synthase reductase n=1 Tax=Chlorella vulgaris TaxID=3077 RepID=A0A9D4TLT6_CHLVU|nr:hypothetical protein D9Q98_005436 [Chlorella vulgaris]
MGDSAHTTPQAAGGGGGSILARLKAQRAGLAPATTTAAAAAAAAAPAAAPAPSTASANGSAVPPPAAGGAPAVPPPSAAAGPRVATGGAAILARLRAQRATKSPAAPPTKELVVLYASQTGTASEIAKNIQAEAEQKGVKGRVASMNEFGFDNMSAAKAPVVIYVASSTGDGDSPDNAAKFYATLRRKTQPGGLLDGIAFTGFGLGDSNYTRYQHVPRAIKQRLLDLGAKPFYPPGEADEVDGIEEGLDKWLEGLWPVLRKAVQPEGAAEAAPPPAAAAAPAAEGTGGDEQLAGVPPLPRCRVRLVWQESGGAAARAVRAAEAAAPNAAEVAYRDPEGHYSAVQPFWAPVTDAKYLTTDLSGPDRQVLHLELDIGGSGLQYAPGDSIGILPQNDAASVADLLQRLEVDGEAVFDVAPVGEDAAAGGQPLAGAEHLLPHLKAPCSVRGALTSGVDLRAPPRKSLLRLLAEHCSEAAERAALLHLCSRDGRADYTAQMLEGQPSLLQLLQQYASCRPPLDALLDALPPLAARMYSVSCSPLDCPGKVQVAFTVVRYSTAQYGEHSGVATTWLHRLAAPVASGTQPAAAAGLRLPIFLRKGGAFGPPEDLQAPLLMIGPGTGVTPFRGFLQHRRAQLAAAANGGGSGRGATWLFFGCRREDQDYLYRQDLEGFEADGTLDHLCVAFSRAQDSKVYVQHLMQQRAAELHELIARPDARIFLCGDGANMAKDVHACLLDILHKQGGRTEAEAAEQLAEMTRQGRYVRDIWS